VTARTPWRPETEVVVRLRWITSAATAIGLVLAACQSTPSATAPLTQASFPPASGPAPTVPAASASPAALASASPAASLGGAAIDPAKFSTTIDNPWFPLQPGTKLTYTGTEGEDKLVETFEITTETKVLDGVTCVVIRDLLKVNGVPEERTTDYYAQDLAGNVWYFGEDTAELDEHGNVKTTAGTWHAGVDGATPGIFMPANPAIGDAGEQEHYVGAAEDRFVVTLMGEPVKVPSGSYTDTLTTIEWTILEPDVLSQKVYVRGIGEVKEFDVAGGSELLQLAKIERG
jgi:hypothetical protein